MPEVDKDELDKKMRKNGWSFVGPILHYEKALENQASVYKKNGKYVVSGIDSSGKEELLEPIEKGEAEKRVKESMEEIKKHMFSSIE
ncbi:MAG: hypothetical protein V5A64_02455 [Candidatus Thermoplasmatota archaeon]